jgi:hypothetical protein
MPAVITVTAAAAAMPASLLPLALLLLPALLLLLARGVLGLPLLLDLNASGVVQGVTSMHHGWQCKPGLLAGLFRAAYTSCRAIQCSQSQRPGCSAARPADLFEYLLHLDWVLTYTLQSLLLLALDLSRTSPMRLHPDVRHVARMHCCKHAVLNHAVAGADR